MEKAIIGKKVGMTQIFDEAGKVIPTVYEDDESIRRIFHCRISKKRRKSRRFITARCV